MYVYLVSIGTVQNTVPVFAAVLASPPAMVGSLEVWCSRWRFSHASCTIGFVRMAMIEAYRFDV